MHDIRAAEVRPGVGLHLRAAGRRGALEYDIEASALANLEALRIEIEGVPEGSRFYVDEMGGLVLEGVHSEHTWRLRQPAPVSWVEDDGGWKCPIAVRFVVDRSVPQHFVFGFAGPVRTSAGDLGADTRIVVDPPFEWSGYFGGSGSDIGLGVSARSSGDFVVGGAARSVDFPTTPGVFQDTGARDGFVAAFDADGASLWATYLGGPGNDQVSVVDVFTGGDVVVGGLADEGFPTTTGAFAEAFRGRTFNVGLGDAFVARLAADGTALRWSTYLGGANDEEVRALAVDPESEEVVFGGWTTSLDFPTTPGAAVAIYPGASELLPNAFIGRLTASGESLRWSTFLGGELGGDWVEGLSLDRSGRVVFGGYSSSVDFPATPGAFQTNVELVSNGIAGLLTADGSAFEWVTLLGGDGRDLILACELDPRDSTVVVAGWTSGPLADLNALASYQAANAGLEDGFVARISPDGRELIHATLFGGAGVERVDSLAIDPFGGVVIGGSTSSDTLPTTADAPQRVFGGVRDGFVARFDRSLGQLVSSSFLGGSNRDNIFALAVPAGAAGSVIAVGSTFSTDLPVGGDMVAQRSSGGSQDTLLQQLSVTPQFTGGVTISDGVRPRGGVFARGDTIPGVSIRVDNNGDLPVTVAAWDVVVGGAGPFDGVLGLTVHLDRDRDGAVGPGDPLLAGPLPLQVVRDAQRVSIDGGLFGLAPGDEADLLVGFATSSDCVPGAELALAVVGRSVRTLGGAEPSSTGSVSAGPAWMCEQVGPPLIDLDGDDQVTVLDVRRLASSLGGPAIPPGDPDGDGMTTDRDRKFAVAQLFGRPAVALAPMFVERGGLLTIDGTRFESGSVLRLGSRPLEVIVRTPRRIVGLVPQSQLLGEATLEVAVPDGAASFSFSQVVTVR